MKIFSALFLALLAISTAAAQNEQSPIVEKDFTYKDWTYKNVSADGETNLRRYLQGKKLVMVVYFAPWCPNWKHDVAFVEGLYEKYKGNGLGVIGVGEYDPVSSMKTHAESYKLTFPIVYESNERAAKQKTLHYDYRKQAGDTRNWGSPWYIFLEPSKVDSAGENLTKKAHVVNGELIKPDAERFIRQKLGLADEIKSATAANGTNEICDPAKPSVLAAAKP